MLAILLIGLTIGINCLIYWLFAHLYKTHKKAKSEHSTKFKVN